MKFKRFIINEQAGVCIGFRNESDMHRYLDDSLTGCDWEVCDEWEARSFMNDGGYVFDVPTSFYGGSLDGLEVMFSIPASMAA